MTFHRTILSGPVPDERSRNVETIDV